MKSKFLGFELKAIDTKQKYKKRRTNVKNKGNKSRCILQVRVSRDKLDEMVEKYRTLLNSLLKQGANKPQIMKRINTTIMGWQNYCQLSTYPSKDMGEVHYRIFGKLKRLATYHGKLKKISLKEAKKRSELINRKYSEYNGKTFISVEGIALCPIWAIKQKRLARRNPNISPYIRDDCSQLRYKRN